MPDTNPTIQAFQRLSLLSFALLTGACSTLAKGTSQDVALTASGAQGAVCQVTGGDKVSMTANPPTTLRLPKSKRDLAISCNAAGRSAVTQVVESTYSPRSYIQHPMGYAVDGATGAMWVYPDAIDVPLGNEQQGLVEPGYQPAPVSRPISLGACPSAKPLVT